MKSLRIFTAVNVSIASARRIAQLQRELRGLQDPESLEVTWVPPANIHVTLKFYGNIPLEQVEGVTVALRNATDGLEPFRLAARGLGVFPSADRPRVLWVGVEDVDGGLAQLHERLEVASAELGFVRDKRPFRGHLTVARIRRGTGVDEMIAKHGDVDCLESTVEEAVVYESRLLRQGAEYVSHARVPLHPVRPAVRRRSPEPSTPAQQTLENDDGQK